MYFSLSKTWQYNSINGEKVYISDIGSGLSLLVMEAEKKLLK
jgi:hypothetical protein